MTISVHHIKSLIDEGQRIVANAGRRRLTDQERDQVERLLEEAEAGRADVELTRKIDQMDAQFSPSHHTKGFGDRLLEAGLAQGPSGNLDVKASRSCTLSIFSALGKAQVVPGTVDISPKPADGVEPLGRDERFAYSFMRQADLGVDLSVRDFRETARAATGTIERDPVSTAGKATLGVTVTAVNTAVKQEAIILDAIPNAVLESLDSFREFADAELRFQIQKAIDLHVYSSLNTGASFGTTGTTMIEKLRNAITAVQADGYTPDLAFLNPSDAAALDLSADAGGFVFPVRTTGTSSPLWNLRIVTRTGAAGTEPPLVVDTTRVGVLYMGQMRFDLDPFSSVSSANFENNTTDIRCEANVLMHVRSAKAARRVAAT